jgi:hypothetical protein
MNNETDPSDLDWPFVDQLPIRIPTFAFATGLLAYVNVIVTFGARNASDTAPLELTHVPASVVTAPFATVTEHCADLAKVALFQGVFASIL